MSVALKTIEPGDWDTLRENQGIVQKNLRQPMPNTRVSRSTNQSIANGTLTALIFDTEVWDVGDLWKAAAPSRLTASTTGLWSFSGTVQWAVNAVGQRQLRIVKNGTVIVNINNRMTNTDGNQPITNIHGEYRMVAGDYVELWVYQNSGGAVNVETDVGAGPFFTSRRIGGYTNEGIA